MTGRQTKRRQAADETAAYGAQAAQDALDHGKLAAAIAGHIANLPRGSVISVQGSWGRGKTDVVTRVFDLFAAGAGPEPIWINPWQYGRADLIQPVIVELLSRMRGRSRDTEWLRATARALLHASNAMVVKAASVVVPLGSVLSAVQDPVDQLIDRVLDGDARGPDADADPVHEMAARFRDLVKEVLSVRDSSNGASDDPLLVCVDDLDRCLPDQQIAMLEAIHFLTSAGANCTFLVAIDPVLVEQAAFAHYHTDTLDINQYLDKLFQLRVNLTALRPAQIEELVAVEFDSQAAAVLRDGLGAEPAAVKNAFFGVFFVPELANPRLVHRTFERLRLAAAAAAAANSKADRAVLQAPGALDALVAWCAVAERWPQLRQMLQASREDQWYANISAVCGYYGYWDKGPWAKADEAGKTGVLKDAASIIGRLPGHLKQPDLGFFMDDRILPGNRLVTAIQRIDEILVSFGL
jgi:hypothetical protein